MTRTLVATAAMLVLAGLDIAMVILAQRFGQQRSAAALVAGCTLGAVLFVVYSKSLGYAGMTTITFGWIVLVEIGVLLIERAGRHGGLPSDKVVVAVALLALQGYLVLAPDRV